MSFERHARTVSLLTLLSRVTGLLRDATISRLFGAAALTDAFFFAFLVPNLFRRLFGEGALSAAFLPVYTRLDQKDRDAACALATLLVARLGIFLGALTIVGEVLLWTLAARSDSESLALHLSMIMLPYMPLVCLLAIFGAMLQVHGRFGPAAAAPIILNLLLIGTAIGLPESGLVELRSTAHVSWTAGAVVAAGVVQVAWALGALRRQRWWVRERSAGRAAFRETLRQAGPMILGLGVLQLNTLFDGVIASYPTAIGPTIFGHAYPLEEGAMAAVSFAQRLYQFPLGVFGIAVATAIFPLLARQADDAPAFADTVRRGLRLVVFVGLPASVGVILVREPMTRVILEGGGFGADDTARVGRVLFGYAPAIWAYSMTHVLTRAFYARGEATTPVRVAIGIVGLNLLLNCTLIWTPLREAGLAISTAICSIIQAVILLWLLQRRTESLLSEQVLGSWGRTSIGVAVMFAVLFFAGSLGGAGWSGGLVDLVLRVLLGAAAFGAVAALFRMPEIRWAMGRR